MKSYRHSRFMRCLCPVLAAILTITAMSGLFAVTASADAAPTPTQFMKWRRVYTKDDLDFRYFESAPMLLFYGGSTGTEYVTLGNKLEDGMFVGEPTNNHPELLRAGLDDEFYTTGQEGLAYWYLYRETYREGELNSPFPVIRLSANDTILKMRLLDSEKTIKRVDTTRIGYCKYDTFDYSQDLKLSTSELSRSWSQYTNPGYVQIMHGQEGNSYSFFSAGSKIGFRRDQTYDCQDFIMYVGERVTFQQYPSFTVQNGETFRINDKSILEKGSTITVEPGGVLSIGGYFVNNGTIRNYGTVVLTENAFVCTYENGRGDLYTYGYTDTYKKDGTSIPGEGNMIIMKDALFSNEICSYMTFNAGTSLIVNGSLVSACDLMLDGAELDVSKNGVVMMGYKTIARWATGNVKEMFGHSQQMRAYFDADEKGAPIADEGMMNSGIAMGRPVTVVQNVKKISEHTGIKVQSREVRIENDGTLIIGSLTESEKRKVGSMTMRIVDYKKAFQYVGRLFDNPDKAPLTGNRIVYLIEVINYD